MKSIFFCHKIQSHPLRVRGLKCKKGLTYYRDESVAPFTGAWIEIG